MIQRITRLSFRIFKIYFLLAVLIFTSCLRAESVLAAGVQPSCNAGGSGGSSSQPAQTQQQPNSSPSSQQPNEGCYDKFLWQQNDIDYYLPCASGSGGSNGSNSGSGTPSSAATGTWHYPTDQSKVTVGDGFGARDGAHKGVDLAAPANTPIYAAQSGTVIAAGPASGFGNWIVIHGDDGYDTVYGHMYDDGVNVKQGQRVNAGDQIGKVGSNGESTGPHLHFEVWEGGRMSQGGHPIDPMPFIDGKSSTPNASSASPASQSASSTNQSTCCSTSDGSKPSTTTLSGSDNAEKIWNYLISQGLTPEQAAGVMGNLAWEGGDPSFSKATSSEEASGGGGFGIAQWTGGRRTALNDAATRVANNANRSQTEELTDLSFQLDYLVQESKGRTQRDGGGNEWEGLRQQKSIKDATDYWMYNYERPGDLREQERLNLANQYYQKYTGKSPSDSFASQSDSGGSACSNSEEKKS